MAYKPLIIIGIIATGLGLLSYFLDMHVNPLGDLWTIIAGVVFLLLGLIPGKPRY